MTPAPSTLHQQTIANPIKLPLPHIDARDVGRVYAAPLDVHVAEETVVEPDFAFISKERFAIVEIEAHQKCTGSRCRSHLTCNRRT